MLLDYKKLLKNITTWTWKIDLNYDYIFCSEGVEDFLDVQAHSLVANSFFSYMDIQERSKLEKAYNNSLINKTPIINFEIKYLHTNSSELTFLLNAIPILDESAEVCGFEGFNTKLVKDESILIEERLELIQRASSDGIWDWNIVDNSVYFDARWKEMLGYKDEELENIIETWTDRVHPDDLEETWNGIQKNLDSDTEYYEGIHRLKHKNGEWVWVLDRGKALYDEKGKAIRMIGTHTDITNKRIEQLKAVHQRQIIEEIHDSVISTNLHGEIIGWNSGSEVLLGYSSSEAIGKHVSMIYLEKDYQLLSENIELLMKNGKNYSTVHLVSKSKEILICNLSLSLLRDENFVPIGMVGYAKDITNIKKAEDTLAKQARMVQMGEMLSMIAHQWRQPLNAIALTSANLRLKFDFGEYSLKPDKEFKECKQEFQSKLENIEEYVSTLSTTINDFKNFYATDKKYTSVKLQVIVKKAMDIMGVSFSNNRIDFVEKYNSDKHVMVYENEIMQVVLNILKNAEDNFLERKTEKPLVSILIEKKSIVIYDNGGGIPDEILERIFDPYFSTKSEKNGTGLGLYLAKTIIEEHHKGKISAQNIDDGVCFKLEFS